MNANYIASKIDEELHDTIFFMGIPYTRYKGEWNGKKGYHYSTSLFELTIFGNKIRVNDQYFRTSRDCKRELIRYII